MQATDEEIGESIEEVTEVVVIEGWVSKPLEGVTGVEVEEKVLVGKVLVLSTEIRGELEEDIYGPICYFSIFLYLSMTKLILLWIFHRIKF